MQLAAAGTEAAEQEASRAAPFSRPSRSGTYSRRRAASAKRRYAFPASAADATEEIPAPAAPKTRHASCRSNTPSSHRLAERVASLSTALQQQSAAAVHFACLDIEHGIANGRVSAAAAVDAARALASALDAFSSDASLAESVCNGVHAAACRGPAEARALAAAPHVIPALFKALRTHANEPSSSSSAAAHALAAIAMSTDGDAAVMTADEDSVNALISALCQDVRSTVSAGAADSLRVASGLANEHGVVDEALAALSSISAHTSSHKGFCAAGAVEMLASLLQPDSGVGDVDSAESRLRRVQHAAVLLANVLLEDDAVTRFIASGGAALLSSWLLASMSLPSDLTAHLCAAMCTLSACSTGSNALFAVGAQLPLLQALDKSTSADAASCSIAWTLKNMCRDADAARSCYKAGGAGIVAAALSRFASSLEVHHHLAAMSKLMDAASCGPCIV
jgi:hypothetical protein